MTVDSVRKSPSRKAFDSFAITEEDGHSTDNANDGGDVCTIENKRLVVLVPTSAYRMCYQFQLSQDVARHNAQCATRRNSGYMCFH